MVAELWIVVGGLTLQLPANVRVSDELFQGFLIVFFLLTAANSLPWLTGEYRRGVSMRPDLIFGGGAYLVRGEIFAALGLKFLTTRQMAHPVWNWWGLTAEFAAMLTLIALRGVLKMRMRRARLLGLENWMGRGMRLGVWVKESFLFAALFAVIYAFDNMYTGRVPFTWPPGGAHGPEWWGFAFLALSFLLLVPLRGWWKTRLPEPPTITAELAKQLLLWLGLIAQIYGFLLLFGGHWAHFYGFAYYNFWWGVWVSALALLMLVPLRTITLREELRGTIRIMTGVISDLPDQQRTEILRRRLMTIAALPDEQRKTHLTLMMNAVQRLPEENRRRVAQTRKAVLATAPAARRQALESSAAEIDQPAPAPTGG